MAGNFYLNSKGERVYGYTKNPQEEALPTPDENTTTAKATAAKSSVSSAAEYYAAAIARQNELLRQQYEAQERARKRSMQQILRQNNAQADQDMQEAYILNMMQQKNLAQKLKNQGMTGGASETVTADIMNTYANNRNSINRARMAANAQAENAYAQGVQGAYEKYLSNQSKLLKSAFLGGNKSQQQAIYELLKSQGLA